MKFRYSTISDFYVCPHLYKTKHIDGQDVGGSSLDTEAGTALHVGVNALLRGESEEYAQELAQMYFDSTSHLELTRFSYSREDLERCLKAWLSKFTKSYLKHFQPTLMEEALQGSIGGHSFEGTPDFIGLFQGVPSVVDFKTSGANWDARRVISEDQMNGYAELVRQVHGYEVKQLVYLVFVKKRVSGLADGSIQLPIKKELTMAVQCSTLDNMKAQMDDISNRQSFPRNTRNCIRGPIVCPLFAKCHGGGEE